MLAVCRGGVNFLLFLAQAHFEYYKKMWNSEITRVLADGRKTFSDEDKLFLHYYAVLLLQNILIIIRVLINLYIKDLWYLKSLWI